ncbi:MAG: hypothetical protein O7A69_00035 [SAR324 cluster bacterium]|nr:hypothetical protein [SAR324 cluster bacterium]
MPDAALYLNAERLLELLTPDAALQAVQAFFGSHSREQVAAPPRIHLPVPGQNTVGLYMPAATSGYVGVKIVHLMPERRPAVEAEVFLYDAETGKLLFWGDGKPLTGLRTAAVSTAATLRLLPRCERLLVYGAGVQAAAHVSAFAAAYPELHRIEAVTRSVDSFRRLQALLPAALRERVTHCTEPAAALAGAQCVITTTPATEPLFAWEALCETCHITAIGSATEDMNEIPPQAYLESRVWVDTTGALREAGDSLAAIRQGWHQGRLEGDLFDLLGAQRAAVPSGGHTLFKSVGNAAQDLAIFIHLWELLMREA